MGERAPQDLHVDFKCGIANHLLFVDKSVPGEGLQRKWNNRSVLPCVLGVECPRCLLRSGHIVANWAVKTLLSIKGVSLGFQGDFLFHLNLSRFALRYAKHYLRDGQCWRVLLPSYFSSELFHARTCCREGLYGP